jgi:16S rRNA (guanine966-N2)-methyltransferase
MRVVAGSLGGRKLKVPEGSGTRPTTDRVREAVFNALFSLGAIEDANVVDLFAGSGALGIEALSRGAQRATFVEQAPAALAVLRDNLHQLDLLDRATVVAGDGFVHLQRSGPFDLVLLDPPYGFDGWDDLLGMIVSGVVVIESDREIAVPPHWLVHRVKRYGTSVVTFASASDPREAAS